MKKNKALEIVSNDITITDNSKDYSGIVSESGIKIIKPVGRNIYNQLIWECQCGYCDNKFYDLPARILNGHKKSCGCLKTKNSNKRSVIIKYSFYEWCTENNHDDWIDLWDYELNDKKPDEVSYKSSSKYWFKCINNNKNHHSELHIISHIVNRGISNLQCKQCNSFAQWGIDNLGEDFLEKYWDYDKNTLDPWSISYSSGNKVWIKCQEKEYHGSYCVMCSKFVNGCRCYYCNKNSGKIHKLDSLGHLYPEVLEIWSDKNDKSPYEYAPQTNKKVWLKCKNGKHDDYLQMVNNAVNRDFRCPCCVEEDNVSVLQNKVSTYIKEKYGYDILHEFNCNLKPRNDKTNYILPYDNEVVDIKLIIEVNGEQHYIKNNIFNTLYAQKNKIGNDDAFLERVRLDKYKKEYALSNGYDYLEIPYTSEKNDVYMKLIDDKINGILKKLNL